MVEKLPAFRMLAEQAHFSPDGDWMYVEDGQKIQVLDRSYQPVRQFEKPAQGRLRPGGLLEVTSDSLTEIWQLDGQTLLTSPLPGQLGWLGPTHGIYRQERRYLARNLQTQSDRDLGEWESGVSGQQARRFVGVRGDRLHCLNVETGESLWESPLACELTMSPDETSLACYDSVARVVDVESGQTVLEFPCASVPELTWCGQGETLITSTITKNVGQLHWWGRSHWACFKETGYGQCSMSPYFECSPDGSRLLTLHGDGRGDDYELHARFWFQENEHVLGFSRAVTSHGHFARVSPDGSLFAINYRYRGDEDQKVEVVHCSGHTLGFLPVRLRGWLGTEGFAFDREGRRMLILDSDGLSVWDLDSMRAQEPPVPRYAGGIQVFVDL